MSNAWMKAAVAGLLLGLGGCVTASPMASLDEDADGKTFAAKPGMARVYLVHGDAVSSPGGETMQSAPNVAAPAQGGILGAVVVGLAQGIIQGGSGDKPPLTDKEADALKPRPLFVVGSYFVDDKLVGTMGKNSYMALDLPPGDYALRFIHGSLAPDEGQPLKVHLEDGTVVYLKSMWDLHKSLTGLHPCDEECPARITEAKRVLTKPLQTQNAAAP